MTNPSKDATVAGHVSMNQESLVKSSQAILQGLAEGGYIHAKTPKFESFFGDDKKNKLDFNMWERQVLSAATTHSGTAVKQAMMQSLKGQALMVISALPPETSWDKLHDLGSRNCAVFISCTCINSTELHLQGVAPRSQYIDPTPEVVTLQ